MNAELNSLQSEEPKPESSKPDKTGPCKFRYGNYNRYYGKRLPIQEPGVSNSDSVEDERLRYLDQKWFEGKRVLDVGCNIGLVTLYIAKHLKPKCIVGIDIDPHLVGVARKNIRHYLDVQKIEPKKRRRFPDSFSTEYGPLAAPPLPKTSTNSAATFNTINFDFPNNVLFKTANYVPENDLSLEMIKPEYDVILALSVTKWVQLNWGDAGLKRFFKRIFRHLVQGGVFILEPQPFVSYKKKRNLTPEIAENYKNINFMPEKFVDYLLGEEVGFESYQVVANPEHKSKGFCRPIFMFQKKTDNISKDVVSMNV